MRKVEGRAIVEVRLANLEGPGVLHLSVYDLVMTHFLQHGVGFVVPLVVLCDGEEQTPPVLDDDPCSECGR